MGSEFYTYKEAADRLNVSQRTVFNYLKKGFLKRYIIKGRPAISKEEVEDMSRESVTNLPALNKENFYKLISRIQKLEQDMTLVRKMLNISAEPLRPDKDQAEMIVRRANEFIKLVKTEEDEINLWFSVLDNIDETFLELLHEHLGMFNPWALFLEVCSCLSKRLDANNSEIGMAVIERARKKLRDIAVIWIELGKYTQNTEIATEGQNPRKGLLDSLLKAKTPPKRG